jgi:hypothetical protein
MGGAKAGAFPVHVRPRVCLVAQDVLHLATSREEHAPPAGRLEPAEELVVNLHVQGEVDQ